ncbi:Uridine nucleosidase 1 [Serendipita sp. 399]|nr:Uridine nucleosidase 1 [Serendipita sp. 399]
MLSTICMYFANAYRTTFGFHNGPPLHDPLTIAYLSQPEIFKTKRYRVDVELAGTHTVGETVVDVWNYRNLEEDDWSKGKNCLVAEAVDVPAFFEILLACVQKADKVTSLNN